MKNEIYLGKNKLNHDHKTVEGSFVSIDGELFYKIGHADRMADFFMTIVSQSDHWMYISSNGSLTAGRKNRDNALFPYYTVDKIHDYRNLTGSKTYCLVEGNGHLIYWEPFTDEAREAYHCERNLYKSIYGNKLIFEDKNYDLGLAFSYGWYNSEQFGWIKKAWIKNFGKKDLKIRLLDGIRNILPYGINYAFQNEFSNLSDAYKRNERSSESSLAMFTLSSIPIDRAEPSEALKATTVWFLGEGSDTTTLISDKQVNLFKKGETLTGEKDIRASKGAYFVEMRETLAPSEKRTWFFIMEVNQDLKQVVDLEHLIKTAKNLKGKICSDIAEGTKELKRIVGSSDGIQQGKETQVVARHFSNTMFNVMRGGVFANNYEVLRDDFKLFVQQSNAILFQKFSRDLENIPARSTHFHILEWASGSGDPDLLRMAYEYLPLIFSRRHGDPSRPWNQFSIELKNEDGTRKLNYQGNWRDIFQNWEALGLSFPGFLESMIAKFLNASTTDGYNPYRITREGIDWESPDPDDPWAYIGYWGDHQIIYLQKLLELSESFYPGRLIEWYDKEIFVFANVPYRIKGFDDLVLNPKDTIEFDHALNREIISRTSQLGADGKLVPDPEGKLIRANLIEKILITLLAKLSNYIPEAGIWLNTQRPEWNDANNALVGNGVSMVTLYYIRRFVVFWLALMKESDNFEFQIFSELKELFDDLNSAFIAFTGFLEAGFSDDDRFNMTQELGIAGSNYRNKVYDDLFSGGKKKLSASQLLEFFELVLKHIDHTIICNKRKDGLYHAYNLISIKDRRIRIRYLYEMLEGQVAVLSSGFLNPAEGLKVMDQLKSSALFREDQYSYILYPDRVLAGFTEKNIIPAEAVEQSELLLMLALENNTDIIRVDHLGGYHFNGSFRNEVQLKEALAQLDKEKYGTHVAKEGHYLLDVFEEMFDHQSFTGRSGTFFGYEGLGSIYWHMVSKLLLAVQECYFKGLQDGTSPNVLERIKEHYYEIKAGIGWYKSPDVYGAFPTDAYSHTPANAGAKQPGLTGQVKEDVLTRMFEIGLMISDGCICFEPSLFNRNELVDRETLFNYYDLDGKHKEILLTSGQFGFTFIQIPIIYEFKGEEQITVELKNSKTQVITGVCLNKDLSLAIFNRSNEIERIICRFKA